MLLEPGQLRGLIKRSHERAVRCGAQRSIPTTQELIADGGVTFVVRIVAALQRKAAARAALQQPRDDSAPPANPFLPYDPDLFVTDLSPTHVALLNKFNVVADHLLLVTRHFEPQRSRLTALDFEALGACLAQLPGLGFYNAGTEAGASQEHKHLQLVPAALGPGEPAIPIASALPTTGAPGVVSRSGSLPWAHAFVRLPVAGVAQAHPHYLRLLAELSLDRDGPLTAPHNLLVTPEWMLMVPRRAEHFESISINALGFAGALLVRNESELSLLRDRGPMAALRATGVAPGLG